MWSLLTLSLSAHNTLPIYNSDWLTDALLGAFQSGSLGGNDFLDSLTYHDLNVSNTGNKFEYLLAGNLLSYVIKERTRMTPEELAKTRVFPLLGISDKDYVWQSNRDGMSYSWHGLFMTVRAMAKLGALYLQRGRSNVNHSIVSESFVLDSSRGTLVKPGYGYGLWNVEPVLHPPERPTRYFAGGLGDQVIFVDENLDRIMAITSNNYIPALAGGEVDGSATALSSLVIDPNCSFL